MAVDEYSNPLPPPSRRRSGVEDPGEPLSNDDFRKFMNTPRPGRGPGSEPAGQTPGQAKKKKPYRPKPKPQEKTEAEESAYRDRASERRKGLSLDYEGLQSNMQDQSINPMSVEDSKYMGGDVDHTHLVKGLDYALLQKVRIEQAADGEEEAAQVKASATARKQDMKFQTTLGQAVYDSVFLPAKINVSANFLPRRMAFAYELGDEEWDGSGVPTTLRRSKEDCPKPPDSMLGAVDGMVLERLAKIMSYMRPSERGKNSKKLRKKDKLAMLNGQPLEERANGSYANGHASGGDDDAGPAPGPPPKMEDDIFGEAGTDYKPAVPTRGGQAGPSTGGYFGKKTDNRDLPPIPPSRSGQAASRSEEDMDLEDGEAGMPLMPPPPPPPDGMAPPPPPPLEDPWGPHSGHGDTNGSYDAYMQANVAYQASQDPEYQALLAKQQALREDDSGAMPPPPPPADGMGSLTQQQKEAGMASVFKRDDDRLGQMKEADARERDPGFVSDAYAECYPGYHDFATAVVDSDDEDYQAMDSKEKGKSRSDFTTEEDWQKYKSNKEAMPKAAFQFGVKMTEGRKVHRDLGKAKDAKLNNQLNKIQGIMEKKGTDHGSAFAGERMPKQAGGETGGGSRKRQRI